MKTETVERQISVYAHWKGMEEPLYMDSFTGTNETVGM